MTSPILHTTPTTSAGHITADGLANIPAAGAFLSVGRSKVYQLLDDGELPSVKMGRCRRIPWRAIHAFAEANLIGVDSLDEQADEDDGRARQPVPSVNLQRRSTRSSLSTDTGENGADE